MTEKDLEKHLERILNEENDFDQMTNVDMMLRPIQRFIYVEMTNAMKNRKLIKNN